MKYYYFLFCALILANIGIYAQQTRLQESILLNLQYESTLSIGDWFDDKDCWNGGAGATSCSIEAGIQMEAGVSGKCSVSCGPNTYACCGIRCICKPYPLRPTEPVDPVDPVIPVDPEEE